MDTNVSGVKSSTTLHSHAKILISVARLATEREGERGRRELWDRRGRRTEARGGRDAARIPPLPRNSDRKNGVGVSTRVYVRREELCVCV